MAFDLAEKRIRAGTASAQEITYFLKRGSPSTKTEDAILERQEELLRAKTDSIRSAQRMDEIYIEAIKAMKTYSGVREDDSDRSNDDY